MTTLTTARQAIRSRLEGGAIVDRDDAAVPLRWQNEEADSAGNVKLPDVPAPFVYIEIHNDGSRTPGPAEFGGGRGNNRWRNLCRVEAYVFVPKGDGLDQAEDIAEQIAVLLRSHRGSDISCWAADVMPGGDGAALKPPGLQSEVDNYFWAMCRARFRFDQIG